MSCAHNVTWVIPGAVPCFLPICRFPTRAFQVDVVRSFTGLQGSLQARYSPKEMIDMLGLFMIAPQLRERWQNGNVTIAAVLSQIEAEAGQSELLTSTSSGLGAEYFASPLATASVILIQDAVFHAALNIHAMVLSSQIPFTSDPLCSPLLPCS